MLQSIENAMILWLGLLRWTVAPAVLCLILLPAWGVPFVYFRIQARRELRELLILRDIAVCRGCGYSLRGLTAESDRCPEYGQTIGEDVRRIIAGPQRFDLPQAPPGAEMESPCTSNPAESAP